MGFSGLLDNLWPTSQVGNLKKLIEVPEDSPTPVNVLLKASIGFEYDFLGAVAAAHIGFVLLFLFTFAYGIKYLNFQRRQERVSKESCRLCRVWNLDKIYQWLANLLASLEFFISSCLVYSLIMEVLIYCSLINFIECRTRILLFIYNLQQFSSTILCFKLLIFFLTFGRQWKPKLLNLSWPIGWSKNSKFCNSKFNLNWVLN